MESDKENLITFKHLDAEEPEMLQVHTGKSESTVVCLILHGLIYWENVVTGSNV